MENLFFIILAALSLFIFFKLGKVKASKKQTDREDRINMLIRSSLSVCFFDAFTFPSLKKINSDSAARIIKNKFSKTYLDLIFAKSLRISR